MPKSPWTLPFIGRSIRSQPSQSVAVASERLHGVLVQLTKSIGTFDPVFQRHATLRLEGISKQLDELLRQELTFAHTETWRTAYEAVLSECQVKRYLSVALIETEDYWQDPPGQASLQFNYELVRHGFYLHRRFIIDDFLWPPGAVRPAGEVLAAIQEQSANGIDVSLIRKSQLETDHRLICDMGIYGERGVGFQAVDEQGRTTSYRLRFGAHAVQEAEELWRQLDLFATPLDEILDRRA